MPKVASKPPEIRGEAGDPFYLTASEEILLANTLSLDFRPPELGSSLVLKPLSSWYFVTVAPEQRNTGQF